MKTLAPLLFFALAIALTWPLATAPVSRIPQGTEQVSTVPALNAWTVWWNADRARFGFTNYWHAPIFAPAKYAFAFSEAQPTTLIVAPLAAVAGPPLAYNTYLLVVLMLNGLVSYRLLKRIGCATVPAALGGAMVETLPIVHWQLGVLQLTTICGVVWVLDRLIALRDRPTALNSLLLGIAAAVCYAACNYFGLFLSVLLPLSAAPLLWGRWLDLRFWLYLLASGLLAGAICGPILWAQFKAKETYEWKREEALLVSLSAHPRDYLNTPWKPFAHRKIGIDADRRLWTLGPGPFKLILAAVGVIAGLAMRDCRRWTLFLVMFAGFAFLLSFGPVPELGTDPASSRLEEWSPYKALMRFHPGLTLARSPFRFAFFVQIGVALLAANALDAIWKGVRAMIAKWKPSMRLSERASKTRLWCRRLACTSSRRPDVHRPYGPSAAETAAPQRCSMRTLLGGGIASVIVVAVGSYAAAEVWPTRQKLWTPPSLDQEWIGWLRRNGDPSRPILCLPFPKGATVGEYERTAAFMYEQIGHRRPMVGGYSGFFPAEFLSLKDQMSQFPKSQVLRELRSRQVQYVVTAARRPTELADRSPGLRLVFRDEDANVSIFQVLPSVEVDYERFFSP